MNSDQDNLHDLPIKPGDMLYAVGAGHNPPHSAGDLQVYSHSVSAIRPEGSYAAGVRIESGTDFVIELDDARPVLGFPKWLYHSHQIGTVIHRSKGEALRAFATHALRRRDTADHARAQADAEVRWAITAAAPEEQANAPVCESTTPAGQKLSSVEALRQFLVENTPAPQTSPPCNDQPLAPMPGVQILPRGHAPMTELLVLSGRGLRFGIVGHYGIFDETRTLLAAVEAARECLANGHARAFVAIRIEAAVIDGVAEGVEGVERELVRFEVYSDRIALVPSGQGGLTDGQKAKVFNLPNKRLV